MEKIRREIKLFWTRNSKSLFQIIGIIAIIIAFIQGLNRYAILKSKDEKAKLELTYEERKQEQMQQKKENEDKELIFSFIDYCNKKNILEAYKMLSDNCKKNYYPTMQEFEENYVKKVFNSKKDCKVTVQEDKTYKIVFLEDILQAGTIENRKDLEECYSIEEDVLGNKTININLYNKI